MTAPEVDPALWLRRYVPAPGARARLVCFPHAGGSASFFHPLARSLAPAADVICLQYPGRQDRRHEPLVGSVDRYADLLAGLLGSQPPLPTVYFGHSLGALIAFEVACRQERDGGGPRALVVSGRRGPATARDEIVHTLDDDRLVAEVRGLEGTNTALLGDEEILRMALPSIRGDFRAAELYTCPPDRTVSCPLTVLIGDDDPKSTVEEAREWERHTTGGSRLRVFPGGHFYLTGHAAAVTDVLRAELAGAVPVGT